MSDQFEDDRKEMQEIGVLYQQIVKEYGDQVNLVYADPRNLISIAVYMFSQVRHGRIGLLDVLKNLFWRARRGAVFMNGRWINNNHSQSNKELLKRIQQEMN
ncbi:hypothetical protein [Bacillus sp. Marseille-Q3570]|uniref:hypothetical protein n=1 Tax=Bacillus sp. Marseille-Q3570 TaxID=2963522 RepID=UPI0021B7C1B8|nr:hypothetical protein [Bacillus sp. Marseille-Q3570]